MTVTCPDTDPTSARTRSRTTNDRNALPGVDGRSAGARRARDLRREFEEFVTGCGGELGTVESNLIDMAVTLKLQEESIRAGLIRGETVDGDELIRLSGATRRTLSEAIKASGTRRACPSGKSPLASYLASKATDAAKDVP